MSSPASSAPLRPAALILLLALITLGCGGGGEDRTRIIDALSIHGTDEVLISYRRARTRHVPGNLHGEAGHSIHDRDVKFVVLHDTLARTTRVLIEDHRPAGGRGGGEYNLRGQRGRKVFLSRSLWRGPEGDYTPGLLGILDLDTAQLEWIDTLVELRPLGLRLRHTPRIVLEDGSVLYSAEDPLRSESELILRRPGGELLRLGAGLYLGDLPGELIVERHGSRWRFDPESGAWSKLDNREYADLSASIVERQLGSSIRVDTAGRSIEQDVESSSLGSARYAPLPITLGDLPR